MKAKRQAVMLGHPEAESIVTAINTLNDTLDELLSLAKHIAPAIEQIAYPDRYLVPDADSIKAKREQMEEARRQRGPHYWLVKTGPNMFQTQLDVTELMTHTKVADETPNLHGDYHYQPTSWASGWEALRCALLGIGES